MSLTIEATHQKWIKVTEEWTQETRKGKDETHFDRVFSFDDMTWRHLGNLKFNVKLLMDSHAYPIINIESESDLQEIISDFQIRIEYSVEGKSGSLTFNPSVKSLSKFQSKTMVNRAGEPEHSDFHKIFYFYAYGAEKKVPSVNVTYKVTFELELKKTEMPSKSKLLHKFYSEGEFSDVEIHCDGKVFHCHKIILSGQSGVFKKMLEKNKKRKHDMVEATTGKIEISDTSATTMENLLFYIYHEDLHKNEAKIVLDLLMAADKYAISDLVNICVKVLKERLSEKNVVDVMTAAYLTNQEELFETAYKFIFKLRIEKNVEIEAWKELDKKNPTLAIKMMKKAMFKM